jgi:holdfast attachment protein HfaA
MTYSKKLLVLTLLAASVSTAAQAGDWSNSGSYNGYAAGSQNSASSYSMRDSLGNLTMVNGRIVPNSYSSGGGQSASAGVGTSGAGAAYGEATAIGNSLNVQVIGMHNTTIIDAQHINNGSQSAITKLNQ